MLETGPGKWDEQATMKMSMEEYAKRDNSKYKRVDTTAAKPTYSHFAIT